jgi:hypothetical protein
MSKTDKSIGRGPGTQRESPKVRGIAGHIEQAERGAIRESPQARKHFCSLLPSAILFVSYGFVLVQVKVYNPRGGHHTKKAGDARQPWGLQRQHTHTSATRRPRLPTPPRCTLTFCAPHAHPLLPTAMAFVSYGFVLVRVRVQAVYTLRTLRTIWLIGLMEFSIKPHRPSPLS